MSHRLHTVADLRNSRARKPLTRRFYAKLNQERGSLDVVIEVTGFGDCVRDELPHLSVRQETGVEEMAKDVSRETTLDDLTDAEIERIEAIVFCAGGPPAELTPCILTRAHCETATTARRRH